MLLLFSPPFVRLMHRGERAIKGLLPSSLLLLLLQDPPPSGLLCAKAEKEEKEEETREREEGLPHTPPKGLEEEEGDLKERKKEVEKHKCAENLRLVLSESLLCI